LKCIGVIEFISENDIITLEHWSGKVFIFRNI
jgi:hypothetical protein